MEGWEEVRPQGEKRDRGRRPYEAELSQHRQEGEQRQVEWRQEEEPVVANAILQPLEVRAQTLAARGPERYLHPVVHLLLRVRSLCGSGFG